MKKHIIMILVLLALIGATPALADRPVAEVETIKLFTDAINDINTQYAMHQFEHYDADADVYVMQIESIYTDANCSMFSSRGEFIGDIAHGSYGAYAETAKATFEKLGVSDIDVCIIAYTQEGTAIYLGINGVNFSNALNSPFENGC